jgi:hypothetical protein
LPRDKGGSLMLRLAACLAAGAAITLAIAWASMTWAPTPRPRPVSTTGYVEYSWPATPPMGWPAPPDLAIDFENFWMHWYFAAANKGTDRYVVNVYKVGFPMRALQSEYWVYNDDQQQSRDRAVKRGIRTGRRHAYANPRLLPTRFLTLGWIVDSAFYGALVLALTTGPGMIRRFLRTRRGACPRCGYDLRGSSGVCPECGGA